MANSPAGPAIRAFRFGKFRTLTDITFEASGQVTIICGPNNSGKSSLLDSLEGYQSIREALRTHKDVSTVGMDLLDDGFEIGVPLDQHLLELVANAAHENRRRYINNEFLKELAAELGGDPWWIGVVSAGRGAVEISQESADRLSAISVKWINNNSMPQRAWGEALRNLGRQGSRAITKPDVQHLVTELVPEISLRRIHDIRRSTDAPLGPGDLEELVRAAASTTDTPPRKRERWARELERLLQDVFGADVRYQATPAPGQDNELRLAIDGEREVLAEQVGAGVREVIAVGFAALSKGGPDVLCIEEPENCLHPTAARRLIQSLAKRTNVQLIVTTHSASVVNSRPDTIIQMQREGSVSSSLVVRDAQSQFRAVSALGHSPADLVLARCAVWVEGPSDRLYLTTWLEKYGLEEGVDYSVMFYGGSLGANVGISGDPDDMELYAQIRPLCRRCVIVADSDQSKKREPRKPHVLRWIEEAKGDDDALVLTTPHREIENCAPLNAINQCLVDRGLNKISEEAFPYARVITDAKKTPKVRFAQDVLEASGGQPGPHAEPTVRQLATFISESEED